MSYFVTNINKEYDNCSLKDFLSSFSLSSDKIKYFINNNCCYINGIIDNNKILKEHDEICIDTSFYDNNDILPIKKELNILYEDEYLLIVEKIANCIIYPDSENNDITMANYVSNYYLEKNLDYKVRHAHRLDYETTGVLIYAKDVITHAALSKMIEEKTLVRKYLAIIEGKSQNKKGFIEAPIGKHRHKKNTMLVSKTGKYAKTFYEVKKENNKYSMVLLKLDTGRTHQIRVHMSHINHPLVGDIKYGANIKESRVLLHSYIVDFIHPITNIKINVISNMPHDFKKYFDT
jgi:23S rRNA pseudouridine1911/1915/1917 synthase